MADAVKIALENNMFIFLDVKDASSGVSHTDPLC